MVKQILLGVAIGVGATLAVGIGAAIAMGHPVPHLFKKVPDKMFKLPKSYWTLSPVVAASDVAGITPSISVQQAKQVADILGAAAFQSGSSNSVSFVPEIPADADLTDAAGSMYYVKNI